MLEDAELLRRYARDRSEAAFAELVRRHVDLVYAVALTTAIVQYQRSHDTATALEAARRQQETLQVEVDALNTRLRQAEQRATDADRDSAELLAAVQAARPAPASPPPVRGTAVAPSGGPVTDEDDRLVQERAYQQALARRRAQEAMARAKLDELFGPFSEAAFGSALIRFNIGVEHTSSGEIGKEL